MAEMIPAWVDGKLTPVDKVDVHREGLRHRAVSVFVMDGEQILIQRRATGKFHGVGLWSNSCCTHPRWNESPEDCATRRLREELGITGIYPAFADRLEYRTTLGDGLVEHEVVDIFLAFGWVGMALTPNPDEVSDLRWVGLYDLAADVVRHPDRYTIWLQIYLEEHMDRIFAALLRN
ncbi:isopentenyl-diphosphate delta-isomerase [Rhodobacter veldkampii DSM 11550]|uniref:Isopentenyl-diphosphate Delta-isomerase n=1 Tax=Phaeovulum veldkampii DSM 11550 TaxID=1185920 RepID=A0A2T4JJ98_9RHOB|nr:NUDIX domain-containing protein [Phaeovulum veldkampii]MBK5947302.1 isopentenyl-diphosphate delta-isomerase [Phaeovulum veldkampii DSM 11550]PTE17952.1 isopentenyl-diphosphate delta-isomerase [Phaeovulum veldkampii DSM 11550]